MWYFGILLAGWFVLSFCTFTCFGNLALLLLCFLSITFFCFSTNPFLGICTISVNPLCLALNRLFCNIVTPVMPSETVISSKVVGKSRYFISVPYDELFEKCRYI